MTWVASCGGILLLGLLLGACNERGSRNDRPIYTQHTSPAKVTISFADAKKLPALSMRIDHRKKRIYNASYLPYESKVDSAYVKMVVTNEATITLHNLTTNKSTPYNPTDTGKIDLTGGKMLLTIEIKDEPTLTYDLRLLTYGYDPLKYTWVKLGASLPVAPTEAQILTHRGEHFWLAKTTEKVELYKVDRKDQGLHFGEKQVIKTADALCPRTAIQLHGRYWALAEGGKLYSSTDLKAWSYKPVEGYHLTQLLGEVSARKSEVASISAIAQSEKDQEYYILTLNLEGELLRATELPEGKKDFPVRQAYVYAYEEGGLYKHNIMSGFTALGKPSTVAFFTSDGEHWGRMPYTKAGEQLLPEEGALFLAAPDLQELFVIGGRLKGAPTALIRKSGDQGVTWKELTKEQAPGAEFQPLYNASGLLYRNEAGDPTFYILGGEVNGIWTTQVWRGELDRSKGIINAYEQ